MQVSVTFRHMESTEALKSYALEKTGHLDKYNLKPADVHWVLSVEKIRHIAEVTVSSKGVTFKAHEEQGDLYSAIDMTIDKLEMQVRKYKEKLKDHKAGEVAAEAESIG